MIDIPYIPMSEKAKDIYDIFEVLAKADAYMSMAQKYHYINPAAMNVLIADITARRNNMLIALRAVEV